MDDNTVAAQEPELDLTFHALSDASRRAIMRRLRRGECRVTEPPVRVGTEVARVAGFMGRRIDYALKVVEHEPGRRIVMDSVRGPFPMRVTYAFEDAPGGGTRVRNRVEGEGT